MMTEYFFDINNLGMFAAAAMLVIASVMDVRKREVTDLLWIAFGAFAVVLLFFQPDIWAELKMIGFSLLIAPLALVIWRIGILGGADSLGLITLAALAPMATLSGHIVTPFTTLTNAAILTVVPVLVNVSRNLIAISRHKNIFEGFTETGFRKAIAMFLGYRASNPKHSFSIEKIDGNSKKLDFSIHNVETQDFCKTSDTWVSPGIPYIVYIAAGFFVQIFIGDIFLRASNIVH